MLWSGAAQAALLVPLLACERRMKAGGGPGIIPFELAGTPERAQGIMERWGMDGRAAARRSLLLDYPFLASYAIFTAAACEAAGDAFARRGVEWLAAVAAPVAAAQFAAAAFDAIENTALLGVLAGADDRLPALARHAARAKFGLLYVGWGYAALGAAARVNRWN